MTRGFSESSLPLPTALLTPVDADARLGFAPGTARRLADEGFLPCYRLPQDTLRFGVEDIDRAKALGVEAAAVV